ncbi:MAG: hydrogenase nickel incorporation protein HypA [Candidatus Bathyarchaeia archaeon]
MHEWALAEAIISAVSETAERERLREISSVVIVIGELQHVNKDILRFAIEQLKQNRLTGAKFIIRSTRAKFICRACGHKWSLKRTDLSKDVREAIHFVPETVHAYLKCPVCGSPDFEISGGRGVWIASIRGER